MTEVARGVLGSETPEQASAGHLEAHINNLELALQRGHYEDAVELFERNVLATFYGLQPDRLRSMLEKLLHQNVDRHGILRGMMLMFPGREVHGQDTLGMSSVGPTPEVNNMLHALGVLASKRLRGHAHRATDELKRLDERVHLVDQLFGSVTDGWGLIIPVQSGITAMLSGDFARALKYFTQAQMQPIVHSLSFFTRDAYAKAALLHATFGDEREAQILLDHAAGIPRTVSWVEYLIDSTVHLTEVMLGKNGAEAAVEHIDAIPLHMVGELWPYYIIALERCYVRAGRQGEIADRLAVLEDAPLHRVGGESMPGSVFSVARATMNLRRGDIEVARQMVSEADPEYIGTQLVQVHLDLSQGRVQQALKTAIKFRTEPAYKGLRQIAVWRYSALASVLLRANKDDEARAALKSLLDLPGGVRAEDAAFLSTSVLEFAEENVEGWPPLPCVENWFSPDSEHQRTRISARELQVVRLLAEEMTQQEIAAQLFVSFNTLKTHIKAIYKKLGVNSRGAAVLRAEREGWV